MGGRIWRDRENRAGGQQRAHSPLPCILCPTSFWPSPEQRALFPGQGRNMADHTALPSEHHNMERRVEGWRGAGSQECCSEGLKAIKVMFPA